MAHIVQKRTSVNVAAVIAVASLSVRQARVLIHLSPIHAFIELQNRIDVHLPRRAARTTSAFFWRSCHSCRQSEGEHGHTICCSGKPVHAQTKQQAETNHEYDRPGKAQQKTRIAAYSRALLFPPLVESSSPRTQRFTYFRSHTTSPRAPQAHRASS